MAAILQFENVGLRHGTGNEVLANIEFEVGRGEMVVVTGGPASGKSRLAALAAGVLPPSRGAVRLFGRAVTTAERVGRNRRIGYVGADLPLLPELSLRENIALPLRIARQGSAERAARVGELLDWLGLGGKGDARPEAVSGAERARAAVARAVVARPDLLIVDEASAMIEPRVRQLVERLMDLGAAVLILTGNEVSAEALPASRRFRLAQSRLIALPAVRTT